MPHSASRLAPKQPSTSSSTGGSTSSVASSATTPVVVARNSTLSDEEDDYLSEKFLNPPSMSSTPSAANTYYERRRKAERESAQKVQINNRKNRSKKEIEEDARREGLSKSLFDRAREEDAAAAAFAVTVASSSRKRGQGEDAYDDPHGEVGSSYALVRGKGKDSLSSSGTDLLGNYGHHSPRTTTLRFDSDAHRVFVDPAAVVKPRNKAFGMMLKMGFKEGQPLGRQQYADPAEGGDPQKSPASASTNGSGSVGKSDVVTPGRSGSTTPTTTTIEPSCPAVSPPVAVSNHLIQPLPLGVWAGRKGLGLGRKRTFASDTETIIGGRPPKILKTDDDPDDKAFRNRAKEEYEERRASATLASARKTLIDLDAKKGTKFDILWIDPHDPDTVPKALQIRLEWIADVEGDPRFLHGRTRQVNDANRSEAERLREEMLAASRPLNPLVDNEAELTGARRPLPRPIPIEDKKKKDPVFDIVVDEEMVEDTKEFLQLNARARLQHTLSTLRTVHFHCLWCGTTYPSADLMDVMCPGEDEVDH